jgi:short-subunit dehydrogenase
VLSSRMMRRFVIGPERVAVTIADAIENGRREVTVPWFPYRLISIAQALVPGLVGRFTGMAGYRPGSFAAGDPGGVPDA